MVNSYLYSTSCQFVTATVLKYLHKGQISNDKFLTFLFLWGTLTSLLNHGFTHNVFQWMDRISIIVLVIYVLSPLLLRTDMHNLKPLHFVVFLAVIAFLWSKFNYDNEELRVKSHQVSHRLAAWTLFAMD